VYFGHILVSVNSVIRHSVSRPPSIITVSPPRIIILVAADGRLPITSIKPFYRCRRSLPKLSRLLPCVHAQHHFRHASQPSLLQVHPKLELVLFRPDARVVDDARHNLRGVTVVQPRSPARSQPGLGKLAVQDVQPDRPRFAGQRLYISRPRNSSHILIERRGCRRRFVGIFHRGLVLTAANLGPSPLPPPSP